MELSDLLSIISFKYYEKTKKYPTKTKLLKLLYLTELLFYRKNCKKILEEKWIYYLFGPYIPQYDELLDQAVLKETPTHEKDITIIKPNNDEIARQAFEDADFDIRRVIKTVLADFGEWDLNRILDFIYYETEPMMNAKTRGEELDFSKVHSSDYYKVKELKVDPKTLKNLKNKYKERISNARKI